MNRKSPIHTLQDLAHTRVDEATRHLGELIASEHACEVKLEMLVQYHREYRERFMETARNGIDPNAWRNFSSFISKLDEAISTQQRIVDNSRQATEAGQQKWITEHSRARAFDTLSHRQHLQELKRQNKQEQTQSDEHAIKRFRGSHSENSDDT